MKFGAMNHPARDIFSEIKKIGEDEFDFIDFTFEPPQNRKMDPKEIRKYLDRYNLEVVGHTSPTLPAIYPVPRIIDACLAEIKHAADFFASLGAKKMNIHPFYYTVHQSDEEKLEANISLLREINSYCQKLGLLLMLENYFSPFDRPEIFKKIQKEVPGLKIHLDIGHCNLGHDVETLVSKFFESFKSDIIHLHTHDNNGITDEHLPIGCGNIDWKAILLVIKQYGYENTVTLEIFCPEREFLLVSRRKLKDIWRQIDITTDGL